VSGGGTLAAALRARTENQGHDQAGLDTAHTRALRGIDTSLARVDQDYNDPTLGAIPRANTMTARGLADNAKTLQRGGIENTNYQADVGESRWFQAAQGGFDPGAQHRVVVRGTRRYLQNPDGTERFLGLRPRGRK
jgi:hypothetical protein